MRRFIFIAIAFLSIVSCSTARYMVGPDTSRIKSIPGLRGTVDAVEYRTKERGLSRRRLVAYLPPSYFQDTLKRYPVMYLLHGARGNEITWQDSGSVFTGLDSLVLKGQAEEFILVLPNINNYFGEKDYKNGHAVNAVRAFWTVDGAVEKLFVDEVVAVTDSVFRTIPSRESRAIAGMSSGALQCIYISANHPEVFGYVGAFSPYYYPPVSAAGNMDFYGGIWLKQGCAAGEQQTGQGQTGGCRFQASSRMAGCSEKIFTGSKALRGREVWQYEGNSSGRRFRHTSLSADQGDQQAAAAYL